VFNFTPVAPFVSLGGSTIDLSPTPAVFIFEAVPPAVGLSSPTTLAPALRFEDLVPLLRQARRSPRTTARHQTMTVTLASGQRVTFVVREP
jgi:hypothetical protein